MKDQLLVITEYHPARAESPGQAIRQTVTAWLAKALRQ